MKIKSFSLILAIALIGCSFNSFAQTNEDDKQEKKADTSKVMVDKKVEFGVGFGLNFVGGTNINLSPNLTYNVSDKIAFGLGVQYNYLALKDIQTTHTYGGNLLFQYSPSQKIMTLLEFVELRVTSTSEIDNITQRFWTLHYLQGQDTTLPTELLLAPNTIFYTMKMKVSTPVL